MTKITTLLMAIAGLAAVPVAAQSPQVAAMRYRAEVARERSYQNFQAQQLRAQSREQMNQFRQTMQRARTDVRRR